MCQNADFFTIISKISRVFYAKFHESAGNVSQMPPGSVRDECGALARVSALSELQKPLKFAENQERERESLTVPN